MDYYIKRFQNAVTREIDYLGVRSFSFKPVSKMSDKGDIKYMLGQMASFISPVRIGTKLTVNQVYMGEIELDDPIVRSVVMQCAFYKNPSPHFGAVVNAVRIGVPWPESMMVLENIGSHRFYNSADLLNKKVKPGVFGKKADMDDPVYTLLNTDPALKAIFRQWPSKAAFKSSRLDLKAAEPPGFAQVVPCKGDTLVITYNAALHNTGADTENKAAGANLYRTIELAWRLAELAPPTLGDEPDEGSAAHSGDDIGAISGISKAKPAPRATKEALAKVPKRRTNYLKYINLNTSKKLKSGGIAIGNDDPLERILVYDPDDAAVKQALIKRKRNFMIGWAAVCIPFGLIITGFGIWMIMAFSTWSPLCCVSVGVVLLLLGVVVPWSIWRDIKKLKK